jgi:hypothetical protein
VLYPLQVLRGILQQKNKDTLSQYLILNWYRAAGLTQLNIFRLIV